MSLASGGMIGASTSPTWLGYVFGSIVGLALVFAFFYAIAFGVADLVRRDDIGRVAKLLWLAAFVLSAGIVLVVYGLVRFSRTEGTAGG